MSRKKKCISAMAFLESPTTKYNLPSYLESMKFLMDELIEMYDDSGVKGCIYPRKIVILMIDLSVRMKNLQNDLGNYQKDNPKIETDDLFD